MKICLIASANSSHTIKWSKWFSSRGHQIEIITFEQDEGSNPWAVIHSIPVGFDICTTGDMRKISYLVHGAAIRRLVREIHPDVVSVHYASGYGIAAGISGIGDYILSVWGSDIYNFPLRSFIHKKMIEFSLSRAKVIFSTSRTMAEETKKYTRKNIYITPFGVDTEMFCPHEKKENNEFVIGTIKMLAPGYGIEYLLRAAKIVQKEHPEIPLKIRIAGQGALESDLKHLARNLGLSSITTWLGHISQEKAAIEWTKLDVAVIPSEYESFGVSAVESEACGIPVVVSDAPGLLESTLPDVSSIAVPRRDEAALAEAIVRLWRDKDLRKRMGNAGRRYVVENFELNRCFENIENLFARFVAGEI